MAQQHADWTPLVVILIVALLSGWVGFELGRHRTHIAAVRAGAGEFYLPDKEAQTPEFRWKTNTFNLKGE